MEQNAHLTLTAAVCENVVWQNRLIKSHT